MFLHVPLGVPDGLGRATSLPCAATSPFVEKGNDDTDLSYEVLQSGNVKCYKRRRHCQFKQENVSSWHTTVLRLTVS